MKKTISIVIIILLVAGGIYYWQNHSKSVVSVAPTPTPVTTVDAHADLIVPTTPIAGSKVTSPLVVTGKARGNWYFEASFPVELQDANGQVLVHDAAQAQGDWMTTDFVPYKITLVFAKPTTATGTLILRKDNPSGLPEHDDFISIPITF